MEAAIKSYVDQGDWGKALQLAEKKVCKWGIAWWVLVRWLEGMVDGCWEDAGKRVTN